MEERSEVRYSLVMDQVSTRRNTAFRQSPIIGASAITTLVSTVVRNRFLDVRTAGYPQFETPRSIDYKALRIPPPLASGTR